MTLNNFKSKFGIYDANEFKLKFLAWSDWSHWSKCSIQNRTCIFESSRTRICEGYGKNCECESNKISDCYKQSKNCNITEEEETCEKNIEKNWVKKPFKFLNCHKYQIFKIDV